MTKSKVGINPIKGNYNEKIWEQILNYITYHIKDEKGLDVIMTIKNTATSLSQLMTWTQIKEIDDYLGGYEFRTECDLYQKYEHLGHDKQVEMVYRVCVKMVIPQAYIQEMIKNGNE